MSGIARLHETVDADVSAFSEGKLGVAREQGERWQKRVQSLVAKYESVDQQEYQRVTTELKARPPRSAFWSCRGGHKGPAGLAQGGAAEVSGDVRRAQVAIRG